MNETPPPLRVFAITARGHSSPSRAASVSANARRSCPSQLATDHPNARNFSSRSPRSLTCETHVSDCTWLRSTITVISPSLRFAVGWSDSQS